MPRTFSRRRLVAAIAALQGSLDEGSVTAQMRLGVQVSKSVAVVAAADLFVITGGRVLVTAIQGVITTTIQTQANNTKILFDPTGTGASTDLCAVLDMSALAAGVYLATTGTLANAMVSGVWRSLLQATSHILGPGTIEMACTASNTGAITWYAWYSPLDEGAALAAS